MKVTCGACFASLRVESWLADNVARCPKCDQVIHIPPADAPAGANAVVLTVEEAADLLRRRAGSAALPSVGQPAPGELPAPRGPKTEPLPAHLRQAAPAIHEEPERQKTRPLPRPVGRPSPVLSELPDVGADVPTAPAVPTSRQDFEGADYPAGTPARRTWLLNPLVPTAFVAGLVIGVAIGWLITRSNLPTPAPTPQDRAGGGQNVQANASNPGGVTNPSPPAAYPPVRPIPPAPPPVNPPTPPNVAGPEPPAATQPETPPPPQFKKSDWLAAQPQAPRATIDAARLQARRRVAGIGDKYPATHLYDPAPPGQIYLELTVPLKRAAGPSVTFRLGGPDADCWLVTRDGQVFEPLGSPREAQQPGAENPVADAQARLTLDDSQPESAAKVVFLVPEQLPAARVGFAASQYADLPAAAVAQPDSTDGRSIEGKWDPLAEQHFAQQYGDDEKILAAMAGAGANELGPMFAQARAAGGYSMTIERLDIAATLTKTARKGYYDATLKMDQAECKATVRLFDSGRQLLIYFGEGRLRQFAFQRSEQSFFGT